jgi:hypothetical protein
MPIESYEIVLDETFTFTCYDDRLLVAKHYRLLKLEATNSTPVVQNQIISEHVLFHMINERNYFKLQVIEIS